MRMVRPLGSLGFAADNNGDVYDVQGPFASLGDSPAWIAGLRQGYRVNLWAMRCTLSNASTCADILTVVGGLGGPQKVRVGRTVTLVIAGSPRHASGRIAVAAAPVLMDWPERIVLCLDEIAGLLLIGAASWMVWWRPGRMTWGFFLYVMWFNPGQDFEAYAFLQDRPLLMLAQEAAQALAVAAGYTGLLQFALRVPRDRLSPQWQPVERALPVIGGILAVLQLASFGSGFGYPTEAITRAGFLSGYAVDAAALLILLRRRRGQPPQDYQRLRWVIWGCLIGLPSFIFADSNAATSLWLPIWGGVPPSDAVLGLFYLLHGVMGVFVLEAIRRQRVIDVSIPLRRITLLALLISVPIYYLHGLITLAHEEISLPGWAWVLIGGTIVFILSRLHEISAEIATQVLSPALRRARHHLARGRAAIRDAASAAAVERLLVEVPVEALRLASAAVFREESGEWRLCRAVNWQGGAARLGAAVVASLSSEWGQPRHLRGAETELPGLPEGLAAPGLVVPIGGDLALALYGPHETGADLSLDERDLLVEFAETAGRTYARLEIDALRRRLSALADEPVGESLIR